MRLVHTADLDVADRAALRALLDEAFEDFPDADWDHCLGGVHVLADTGGELAGHASVVQRQLRHAGRTLRTGYVEAVAVRPSSRRTGVGAALMAEVERVVRGAYDVGALGATEEAMALYTGRGWLPWRGALSALTPGGVVATPQERGSVLVLPGVADLDPDGELTCDWRAGDLW